MMKGFPRDYRSYMLRLWLVQGNGDAHWRASLEDVQSGELHGFANLAAMLDYLQALTLQTQQDEMDPDQGDDIGDIENKSTKVRTSQPCNDLRVA